MVYKITLTTMLLSFCLAKISAINSSAIKRRILKGQPVTEQHDKGYMVYLIGAEESPKYVGWTCGGAIVSPSWIITSAACCEDVQHMYVIPGTYVYVDKNNIDTDDCTKASKKKVIEICVPKPYEFSYDKLEKWTFIDIATAKVDSPFDYTAKPHPSCAWIPRRIKINYDVRKQAPGTDAIVLGWGHSEMWRSKYDLKDYNQNLHFTTTMVRKKDLCLTAYKNFSNILPTIQEYMLCTEGQGNIDLNGEEITALVPDPLKKDGCSNQYQDEFGMLRCRDDEIDDDFLMTVKTEKIVRSQPPARIFTKPVTPAVDPRKDLQGGDTQGDGNAISFDDIILNVRRSLAGNESLVLTRRNGICQNDHGSPLVTWVGNHETVIGVASVFRITEESKCTGPFLYTSTQCNGAFLYCVLWPDLDKKDRLPKSPPKRRSNIPPEICSQPAKRRGFYIHRRTISWKNHPEGPAMNEKNVETSVETMVLSQFKTEK